MQPKRVSNGMVPDTEPKICVCNSQTDKHLQENLRRAIFSVQACHLPTTHNETVYAKMQNLKL